MTIEYRAYIKEPIEIEEDGYYRTRYIEAKSKKDAIRKGKITKKAYPTYKIIILSCNVEEYFPFWINPTVICQF